MLGVHARLATAISERSAQVSWVVEQAQDYPEEVSWVAIDPGTYRGLTLGRGLSPAGFET